MLMIHRKVTRLEEQLHHQARNFLVLFSRCFPLKASRNVFVICPTRLAAKPPSPASSDAGSHPTMNMLAGCVACLLWLFGPTASADAVSVRFQWNASTGSVAGYKLYQGALSGAYLSSVTFPGTGTSGTMDLDPSASRYVAATAYDSGQNESAFSNEILCHPVTASVAGGIGGTISPSGTFFVQNGNSVTFTLQPSSGYQLSSLTVNGTSVSTGASYTVTGVTRITSVQATFSPISSPTPTHAITVTPSTNGVISPSNTVMVPSGESQTFSITPSTGYRVQDVRVDNVSVGALTSYTFTNVTAAHTISATFALRTYAITATTGANGTISPTSAMVRHGASQTFSITPSTGYRVQEVRVDNVSVGAVTSYTFTNVTAAHTISATFAIRTYTIAVTTPSNGTISPSGNVSVSHGSSQSFTIRPAPGYRIRRVLVDGVSVGAVSTYSFTGVTADHRLAAEFARRWITNADAGPDQNVAEATTVTLNGANSSGPDDDVLAYSWEQTSGPSVALSSPDTASPAFSKPEVGEEGAALTFRLTVSDREGLTATDTCIVNVTSINQPPLANPGATLTASAGSLVWLDGSKSTDPDDGIVSYQWVQRSGPRVRLSNATSAIASFHAPHVGLNGASLTFKLNVQDKGGLKASALKTVHVTGGNTPPKAKAGPDQAALEGQTVVLDGLASRDLDDGIRSYRWTQTSGPPVRFLNHITSAVLAFDAPAADSTGTSLTFRLTVTDEGGLESSDSCVLSVTDFVGPDLRGEWKALTYSGSTASGSLEARNSGALDSGELQVAFYLSRDGKTLDTLVTRKTISSLSAGQAETLSFSYSKSGLEGWYIVAVLDSGNAIGEISETNNQATVIVP